MLVQNKKLEEELSKAKADAIKYVYGSPCQWRLWNTCLRTIHVALFAYIGMRVMNSTLEKSRKAHAMLEAEKEQLKVAKEQEIKALQAMLMYVIPPAPSRTV